MIRRDRAARRRFGRRQLWLESLEQRSLLAGNVFAQVDAGGNLTLRGDNQANSIEAAQVGANSYTITGVDTTVNGGTDVVNFAGITGSVNI
jgi:hypothetical protein